MLVGVADSVSWCTHLGRRVRTHSALAVEELMSFRNWNGYATELAPANSMCIPDLVCMSKRDSAYVRGFPVKQDVSSEETPCLTGHLIHSTPLASYIPPFLGLTHRCPPALVYLFCLPFIAICPKRS